MYAFCVTGHPDMNDPGKSIQRDILYFVSSPRNRFFVNRMSFLTFLILIVTLEPVQARTATTRPLPPLLRAHPVACAGRVAEAARPLLPDFAILIIRLPAAEVRRPSHCLPQHTPRYGPPISVTGAAPLPGDILYYERRVDIKQDVVVAW